jgi:hypothetical protein
MKHLEGGRKRGLKMQTLQTLQNSHSRDNNLAMQCVLEKRNNPRCQPKKSMHASLSHLKKSMTNSRLRLLQPESSATVGGAAVRGATVGNAAVGGETVKAVAWYSRAWCSRGQCSRGRVQPQGVGGAAVGGVRSRGVREKRKPCFFVWGVCVF